jgi:hypothetical protein
MFEDRDAHQLEAKPCKSCSSNSLAEAMRRHTSERRRQMLASSDKCFLLSLPKLSLKDRALRKGKFNILLGLPRLILSLF